MILQKDEVACIRKAKRFKNFLKKLKIKVEHYCNKIDTVSSLKQELIFAIPQALASMEEHVSMHWTPLFATVRCDTRENIVEVRERHFVLFQFLLSRLRKSQMRLPCYIGVTLYCTL